MIDLSGLFSTFNIVKRALAAQQYALNTTAHNIANAGTDGYSRQRVTMKASTPEGSTSMNSSSGPGQIGTGVEIGEVQRFKDQFLDSQIRNETSTSEDYKAREQFLSQVESIFQEPSDVSLNKAIGDMFNSWQNLSGNPVDPTLKTGVIQSSLTVTGDINHMYDQLDSLESNSDELIQDQVYSFNSIVGQIEDLNKQIRNVEIGGNNPNDLLDKQDLLIDNLSKLMNIEVSRNDFGEAAIKSGGTVIIGQNSKNLSYVKSVGLPGENGDYTITYYNNGDINNLKTYTVKSGDADYESLKDAKLVWTDSTAGTIQKADLQNGSIAGYASVKTEIDGYKNQLDALSRAIAISVNTILNDGKTPTTMPPTDPPTPTEGYVPFFTNASGADDGTISASNITVNPDFVSDPASLLPDGDGDIAIAVAQLTGSKLFINEFMDSNVSRNDNSIVNNYSSETRKIADEPGGSTILGYYGSIISELGSSEQHANNIVSSQDNLLSQLNLRKQSVSGVSINEEITNMIQYQRSFEAAAKMVNVIDELLNTVVNGLIR